MIKCPHYEPYYDEVERSKCLACPIKCYTFLKEEFTSLSAELERLREEVYKRNRRALAWKRMSKILYGELKIMTFEIKEMTKRLKRVLG